MKRTREHRRLQEQHERQADWQLWGPYLSERAWGTVREDYSEGGHAWEYFPHDHARSRAYRWNEDGLAGICDRSQYLCFALALWNGRDPILKERLFGLTGPEGNHGEDVKEYYFYLDSTPTHSYMRMLYKYPQAAFPYAELVRVNAERGLTDFEYELLDTGIFADNRYFDVTVEYAKQAPDDIGIRVTVANRGPERAECVVLPTLWFRNTWSWGYPHGPMKEVRVKPSLRAGDGPVIEAHHPLLGLYHLYAESAEIVFTENETNAERVFGVPNTCPYVKDAFHHYVIDGAADAVNPDRVGTKAAFVYRLSVAAGRSAEIRLRLSDAPQSDPFDGFGLLFRSRRREADTFYEALHPPAMNDDSRLVQRQALAGMLWSKQLYYFDVEQWLDGDPVLKPPEARRRGRNFDWLHLNNFDILAMPDKWEYPWYAGWDLAFHCIPLAMVDPEFAKSQLILLTREWYMHPNGQLPAYEWSFGDVNPPVHAWAAWRVYELDAAMTGQRDLAFLQRVFHKMLINFTWWVNRKDVAGRNIFQGGFLGLDNISVFDRSSLPTGGYVDQSDGTAWMGFYCLTMMSIAIELARANPVYQDLAVKFFEHFLSIAVAMSGVNRAGQGLWDEDDQFYYDVLRLQDGTIVPLKVRSLVGLIPLMAVETIRQDTLDALPAFASSVRWMTRHREHLTGNMMSVDVPGYGNTRIVSIPTREHLDSVLRYMLDENEFLSPYGIRSLSKIHQSRPYSTTIDGNHFYIDYQPAESTSRLFGGNSNWRGPVWFPLNYLLIEALRRYHRYFRDTFKVECPTGSGRLMTLGEVADDLARRLTRLFLKDESGRRPCFGALDIFRDDEHWRDRLLFHEYFHGDNGAGLGASHQTGWTGLVADLLQQVNDAR